MERRHGLPVRQRVRFAALIEVVAVGRLESRPVGHGEAAAHVHADPEMRIAGVDGLPGGAAQGGNNLLDELLPVGLVGQVAGHEGHRQEFALQRSRLSKLHERPGHLTEGLNAAPHRLVTLDDVGEVDPGDSFPDRRIEGVDSSGKDATRIELSGIERHLHGEVVGQPGRP